MSDEPLEDFYGDDADEARLLAEADEASAGAEPGPQEAGGASGARKKTVTGALMAGIAMGLREVFQPEYHDRIAIEQPAPELPDEPQKYEIHLDPVAPESSFAIYRPWLDGEVDGDGDGEELAESPSTAPPAPAAAVPAEKPKSGGMGALGG